MTKHFSFLSTHPSSTNSLVWQREFEACLNQSDPQKLLARIHSVEAAIGDHLRELAQGPGHNPDHELSHAERQAITKALETLRALKRDKLGFPDWNGKA
jgi:hypothetical protein